MIVSSKVFLTYRPRKSRQHDLRGHRLEQVMVYSDAISRVIPPRLGYVT
jgi:hypothetical protein